MTNVYSNGLLKIEFNKQTKIYHTQRPCIYNRRITGSCRGSGTYNLAWFNIIETTKNLLPSNDVVSAHHKQSMKTKFDSLNHKQNKN